MPKKIMVIDDEPDIQLYLTAVLEDHGYKTCIKEENETIRQAVGSCDPDLIILDIMMPKRSGLSIYKELKTAKGYKEIPIVLISGLLADNGFTEAGFNELIKNNAIPTPEGFIEKPIKVSTLMDCVKKILAQR